jgi:hypothetical protein
MKYAIEMFSVTIIYVPSSIKIGSGSQKLMGDAQTHGQQGDVISLHLFFQSKASRLVRIKMLDDVQNIDYCVVTKL